MSLFNLPDSLSIRPTYFIGFGGSGTHTLTQVYHYISEFIDIDKSRYIDFFIIDSDDPSKILSKNNIPYREYGYHFFYDDLSKFEQGLNYRFVKEERLPSYLGRTPLRKTSDGAGICRIFGLCSLINNMDKYKEILKAILDKAKDVNIEKMHIKGIYSKFDVLYNETSNKINIVFVGSNSGGTASGMMLDAIAYTRHYSRIQNEDIRLSAVIFEPGIFNDDNSISSGNKGFSQQTLANAYAFKKELYHFSENDFEFQHTPSGYPTKVSGKTGLLDHIYLIDSKGLKNNTSITSAEDAFHTAAEILVHFAISPVGEKLDSIAVNERENITRLYPFETAGMKLHEKANKIAKGLSRKKIFSSFGINSITIYTERIKTYIYAYFVYELTKFFNQKIKNNDIEEQISSDINNKNSSLWKINFKEDFLDYKNSGNINRDEDFSYITPFNIDILENNISEAAISTWQLKINNMEKELKQHILTIQNETHPIFTDIINVRLDDIDFGIGYVHKFLLALNEKVNINAQKFNKTLFDQGQISNGRESKLKKDIQEFNEKHSFYLKMAKKFSFLQSNLIKSSFIDDGEISTIQKNAKNVVKEKIENEMSSSFQRQYQIYKKYIKDLQTEISEVQKIFENYSKNLNAFATYAYTESEKLERSLSGYLIEKQNLLKNRRMRIVATKIVDEVKKDSKVKIKENLIIPFLKYGLIINNNDKKFKDIFNGDFSIDTIYKAMLSFVKKRISLNEALLKDGFDSFYFNNYPKLVEELTHYMYNNAAPLLNFRDKQGMDTKETEFIISYNNDGINISKSLCNKLKGTEQKSIICDYTGKSKEIASIIRVVHGIAPNAMHSIKKQWRAYRSLYVDNEDSGSQLPGHPLHIFKGAAQNMKELFTYDLQYYPFVDHADLIDLALELGIITQNGNNLEFKGVRSFEHTAFFESKEKYINFMGNKKEDIKYKFIKECTRKGNDKVYIDIFKIKEQDRAEHAAFITTLKRFTPKTKKDIVFFLNEPEQVDFSTEIIDECIYNIAYKKKNQASILKELERENKLPFIIEQCYLELKVIGYTKKVPDETKEESPINFLEKDLQGINFEAENISEQEFLNIVGEKIGEEPEKIREKIEQYNNKEKDNNK